jgi:hypothetical protein
MICVVLRIISEKFLAVALYYELLSAEREKQEWRNTEKHILMAYALLSSVCSGMKEHQYESSCSLRKLSNETVKI